jgi:hypothetical protein
MASRARRRVAAAAAFVLALHLAGPAMAAACFNAADVEAEQALRYENELMVLSDTCGGDSYRDFTLRNRTAIIAYQRQLMDHFRRTGARSPQAALDSFQTKIANEEALRAADESAPTLCGRMVAFLEQGRTLDQQQFRRHAAMLATENKAQYRICRR